MAKEPVNFGNISEALNEKADRDLKNVDQSVTLLGRSGGGADLWQHMLLGK